MRELIDGVARFQRGVHPVYRRLFEGLAHGQSPGVLFIACSDSRVDPSLITQSPPGTLFVLRNAGNLVPPGATHGAEAATVHYAVDALRVKHIVVCGHSGCGAMKALVKGDTLPDVLARWLVHAGGAGAADQGTDEERLARAVRFNAAQQLAHLRTHPCVEQALAAGRLSLHAWVYDIPSGEVEAWDPARGEFLPLADVPDERAVEADLEEVVPLPPDAWRDHGPYSVRLTRIGHERDRVLDALRQITGGTVAEVDAMLERLPTEVMHGLTELEAEIVHTWIAEAGGRSVVSRDDAAPPG